MLTIDFTAELQLPNAGGLVLLVTADRQLSAFGVSVDEKIQGSLRRAMTHSHFDGEIGTCLMITAPNGLQASRVLLVGIGESSKLSIATTQEIGRTIVKAFDKTPETTLSVIVEDLADGAQFASQLALGAQLGSYRFDRYKSKPKPQEQPTLERINVFCSEAEEALTAFSPLQAIAEGISLTRDLASEPANVLTPVELAERCRALQGKKLEVEILEPEQLQELRMGALLGVARGSSNPPRVVIMRYRGARRDKQPLAFIGKGVTFDTGGYSLKPPKGMEDMKMDMCGAAIVIGLMKALAGREAKVNAVGVVGLVENMVSGNALRPGDIITSMSGQTIEVLNTDAEGRLVLADLLYYTETTIKPRLMIDLATLTGAIIVALGHVYGGLFSNNEELAGRLLRSGELVKDRLWQLPLDKDYDKLIDSRIADLQNIGPAGQSGSITAAQFLQRFVNDTPWAHIDVAGVSIPADKGSNGFGVQLLSQLVAAYYE